MIEKFKNEEFLQQFFLTEETIMEYFYTSIFFDTSSNNAILRNQNQNLNNLQMMIGKYYELYYYNSENNLFIILEKLNKLEKENNFSTKILNGFYIINNEISICPSNYDLFETEIINYISNIENEMMEFVNNRNISFFNNIINKKEEEEEKDFIEEFLNINNFLNKN